MVTEREDRRHSRRALSGGECGARWRTHNIHVGEVDRVGARPRCRGHAVAACVEPPQYLSEQQEAHVVGRHRARRCRQRNLYGSHTQRREYARCKKEPKKGGSSRTGEGVHGAEGIYGNGLLSCRLVPRWAAECAPSHSYMAAVRLAGAISQQRRRGRTV